LGMSWFKPLGLTIGGIHQLQQADFADVCNEFPRVFDGSLGKFTGAPISLDLDPAVRPIRIKARFPPLTVRPKIEAELDKLVAQGVLESVASARWETPIVTPIKPNGDVRICADYKCTINKALQDHAYPVPVVSHVLAALAGARIFGKLDLAQAYQQLPVDAATAEAQTIATHRGAFKVHRLQFGVSVAPGIFQSFMDSLLKGIPGVQPFLDDVLIAAPDAASFATRLRTVLQRFDQAGLKVKREKCLLGVPKVEFLGFAVDAQGIHPTAEKTRAISNAPAPTSKTELQQAAFRAVKDLLVSNSVLAHFNEDLPVVLACDASPYGVGAVLGHKLPDGREVPVAYYSRTLSAAERNYAQIDKEALAIVAGVKKFHHYLYGRPFTVLTDHKPLLGLLAPDRQTPQMTSPRVIRWSVFLAGYNYMLLHRPGKAMGHADALSRLPLPETEPDPAPAHHIALLETLPDQPVHVKEVARRTEKDPILCRVLDWVRRGWPLASAGPDFAAYASRKDELSAHKGCVLWGGRVVIPSPLRDRVLAALHEAHPGVVRMKALARSYVWWPGLDQDIERLVKLCQPCQAFRPAPPRAPDRAWESSHKPCKWLEVVPVPSTSSKAAIRAMRHIFSSHGLPDTLVTDNGTAFTSSEFQDFTRYCGIRHVRHPAMRDEGMGNQKHHMGEGEERRL
ncbi:PREDICTED: uncharacterized protein K02A2.6-like, partial [Gekko japonicus]|uniref:Gypsy retrotransposon integrase-like protein 1 n=1 Tax=Gekko japonicus TaxID=146911 RepID=A0ABM1KMY6_GEKJA